VVRGYPLSAFGLQLALDPAWISFFSGLHDPLLGFSLFCPLASDF